MDKEERDEVIYHGTTYEIAQLICAQKRFAPRETYFSSTRSLAELFADRACGKRAGAHVPAVVRVVLYESDLKLWKRNNQVRSIPFSEGDRRDLQGKTQLVFSEEAIRFLNRDMFPDELRVEPVKRDG